MSCFHARFLIQQVVSLLLRQLLFDLDREDLGVHAEFSGLGYPLLATPTLLVVVDLAQIFKHIF